MPGKEARIQSIILKDLESLGDYCECFKTIKLNKSGYPDIFFTTPWTGAVFVEVKRPGEKPRPEQIDRIKGLNKCGCKAYWVDSVEAWIELRKELGISRSRIPQSGVLFSN